MDFSKTPPAPITEIETLRQRVVELEREANLREGETSAAGDRQFRDLVEHSVQGFYIHDHFKILFANQAAASFFGYESVDALMEIESVLDLFAPEEWTRARALNKRRRAKKGVPHQLDFEGMRRDGTIFRMEIISQIVIWEGREATQNSLVDITERKKAEKALQESEAKYRDLVETSHDLIWKLDEAGLFTYLNPAWEETLGYDPEEMLGRSFMDFKIGPNAAQKFETHKEILTGRILTNHESSYLTKSGEERRLNFNAIPVYDSEGEIVGTQGTAQDVTERWRAEEELRASQRLMETVFNTIPHSLFVRDANSVFLMANRKLANRYGMEPEDFKGLHLMNIPFATQAQRQQFLDNDREVLKTGRQLVNDQIPVSQTNGQTKIFTNSIQPLRGENGEIIGLVGIAEDITERKQAEQELRESRDQLSLLIDNLPALITYVGIDRKYKIVNKTMESWFGRPRKEILGHSLTEFFSPADTEYFTTRVDEVFRGKTLSSEEEIAYPDGVTRQVDLTFVPDLGPEQSVRGYFGLVQDITQRKRAEAELSLHSEIVKHMVGGVIMFRAKEETIAYTTPNFDEMFGYAHGKLLGKNVYVLNAPGKNTPEQTAREIIESIQEHGWWRGEIFNIKKDGTRFWTLAYISNFSHSQFGSVVLCVQHDITEQKQIEEQLHQSQKMEAVGQLAGGIAHEFNNMLQVIITGVYFARKNLHDARLAEEYLGTVLNSAERSAELTRQLLTFSRKTTLTLIPVNLNELISNLMKMVRPIIGEEISLDFRQAGNLFTVQADPRMLEQALVNLCVNARDSMPGGGRLILTTRNHHADQEFCDTHGLRQPGNTVMISVSDEGGGISPEIREHIFEPFFTTKEVGRGTGLGLSMVHGIIQQHGGAIEVITDPGVGSTFNIYLPQADSPLVKKDVPDAGKSPGGSETILIAEDEAEVLNMLHQTLESRGYSVLGAKDGEEALSAFKENGDRIDLVILDMVMPKMRGWEVYEQIRGSGSDVPVLFSTGYSLDSSDAEFVAGRGLRTIQKPYTPNDLYLVVRDMLDRR